MGYADLVETFEVVKDKPIVGEVPEKATTARNLPKAAAEEDIVKYNYGSTSIQLLNPGDELKASTTTPPSWWNKNYRGNRESSLLSDNLA